MTRLDVSIVIPTHNRRDAAARALQALSRQCCSPTALEIILVADGCTDDTGGLSTADWSLPVRVLEQRHAGPAAARNRGAAAAKGDLLIFLDDDIEVLPGFVAAHVEAHAPADSVVIGYLPPQLQGRRDLFSVMLRAWWEAMFERMRDPGHRFAYSDLLSGNFSVSRSLFERAGGFDETLRCHEDYELGYRLIAAGARFQFAPAAAGWHHEHTDLARALRRKRDEGRADVALARKYPKLAASLPLARPHTRLTRRGRVLRYLAVTHPAPGDTSEALCRRLLGVLEAMRLRTRWRRLLDDLLSVLVLARRRRLARRRPSRASARTGDGPGPARARPAARADARVGRNRRRAAAGPVAALGVARHRHRRAPTRSRTIAGTPPAVAAAHPFRRGFPGDAGARSRRTFADRQRHYAAARTRSAGRPAVSDGMPATARLRMGLWTLWAGAYWRTTSRTSHGHGPAATSPWHSTYEGPP